MALTTESWGYVSNEKNYDDSIESPSWGDVLRYLKGKGVSFDDPIAIIIQGKLKYSATGRKFDGWSGYTTANSILNAVEDQYGVKGEGRQMTLLDSPDMFSGVTEKIAWVIMGYPSEVPEKVTYIEVTHA